MLDRQVDPPGAHLDEPRPGDGLYVLTFANEVWRIGPDEQLELVLRRHSDEDETVLAALAAAGLDSGPRRAPSANGSAGWSFDSTSSAAMRSAWFESHRRTLWRGIGC